MTDTVRFGIVGLGMGRHRAGIAAQTPGAKLVAVCDLWEERGRSAAEELGCEWLRDFDDLLAREDLDCIGVFTPSGMHAEFATRALLAGKHVFVSKPLDLTLEACDQALAAAERTGKLLAVDFELRYDPRYHQLRAALREGALGRLILGDLRLRWYRGQAYYDGGFPAGWRSRLATERGSLANQAVHYLDLLQWWLGPVVSVCGQSGTFAHDIETEDTSLSLLSFASGAYGTVVTSTCSIPELGWSLEVMGNAGNLRVRRGEVLLFRAVSDPTAEGEGAASATSPHLKWQIGGHPPAQDLRVEDYPAPAHLPANIIEDMIGAITQGRPVQCDGREGRKTVEIFAAIYRSAESGARVTLG